MARKNKTPHHSLTFQSEQKLKSKLAIGDSKDLDKALESKRLCEKRKHFLMQIYLIRNVSQYIRFILGVR